MRLAINATEDLRKYIEKEALWVAIILEVEAGFLEARADREEVNRRAPRT